MDVCVHLDTAVDRTFSGAVTINTTDSLECAKPPVVAAASPYCVIAGSTINIASGAVVRGIGTRPLVFAASGAITVDGTIDVSSTRADRNPGMEKDEVVGAAGNYASCQVFIREAHGRAEGGGGGAGGTFGDRGGNGGDGNYDVVADRAQGGLPPVDPDAVPNSLRGGCRGQNGGGNSVNGTNGGRGGPSGGAVYLVSKANITINGGVLANGAGGMGGRAQAGGGGGGSGGLIVLEAPGITRNGKLAANGGGGGEGGVFSGTETIGADGADGVVGTGFAAGGNSTPPSRGGDGGARSRPVGEAGTFSDESGGAGGGGVGHIRILGLTSATGLAQESPAPSITN